MDKLANKICDCTECLKPIYEGDMIYEFDNEETIHNHCLQDWASKYEKIAEIEENHE